MPHWSFSYDGFGNRSIIEPTSTIFQGSQAASYDPATNRPIGGNWTYNAALEELGIDPYGNEIPAQFTDGRWYDDGGNGAA